MTQINQLNQRIVSPWASRMLTRLGSGAIGLGAIAALVGLEAPIAQAQNWSLLDCLRQAGTDAYAVARCKNPNAQAPNLEEPITPSPSSSPSGPQPTPSSPSSSSGGRPTAGPGPAPTAAQPYRPGPPASSYNSANRVRVTLDCLNNYSEQPNAVLSACGAWGPHRQPAGSTTTPPAVGSPSSMPMNQSPSMLPR